MEGGIHAGEVKEDSPAFPTGGDGKLPSIDTRRILRRHPRRIDGERIENIGVMGMVVSLQLPMPRHLNVVPAGGVKVFIMESRRGKSGSGSVEELPVPVQQLKPWRSVSLSRQGTGRIRVGQRGGPGCDAVFGQQTMILPVVQSDQPPGVMV